MGGPSMGPHWTRIGCHGAPCCVLLGSIGSHTRSRMYWHLLLGPFWIILGLVWVRLYPSRSYWVQARVVLDPYRVLTGHSWVLFGPYRAIIWVPCWVPLWVPPPLGSPLGSPLILLREVSNWAPYRIPNWVPYWLLCWVLSCFPGTTLVVFLGGIGGRFGNCWVF